MTKCEVKGRQRADKINFKSKMGKKAILCGVLAAALLGMSLLSTEDFVQVILFGKDILFSMVDIEPWV